VTDSKYGNLVKKLEFKKGTMGGANARELVFVGGDELSGFDLNFIIGVYEKTGDWAPNRGAHSHPFDECLLFFGYDDKDLGYLGSELELSLGSEQEKHKFSVPTIALAPKGMPHCPLITKKVYKPFGHFHLALGAKYSGSPEKLEGTTDGNKYAHLIKPLKVKGGPGGADAKQLISMSGNELEGININFQMGLYNETGPWQPGRGALVHPYDKCMVFFGHNTDDLSYLGAEITVELGKEHEKHTFNVPTVISIPKGTPHFPVVCDRVDRPYSVMHVGLAAKPESSWID
jgi:hypothetical protein